MVLYTSERMARAVTRRDFLASAAGGALLYSSPRRMTAAPFPVHYWKSSPYEALYQYIEPGHDEFTIEKQAAEIASHLDRLVGTRKLPLAAGFQGVSPMPVRYKAIAKDVALAEFDAADSRFERGLERWLNSLAAIRSARFFVLAGGGVRYEISSPGAYRVGLWKQSWADGRLLRFEPIEETLVTSAQPLFQDVTAPVFGGTDFVPAAVAPGRALLAGAARFGLRH